MSRNNALEVYDPEIVHQQARMEVRAKMAARGEKPGQQKISPNAPIWKMFAQIAEREAQKFREREEERRRRDPSYRPDALDFEAAAVREFDREVDYYARLGLDQFASALEIKRAYMKLSLRYHPDKQVGKPESVAAQAVAKFKELTEAYEVLADQATRRQYDRERDKMSAAADAGLGGGNDSASRLPPSCVDVTVTLEQLYRGVVKKVGVPARFAPPAVPRAHARPARPPLPAAVPSPLRGRLSTRAAPARPGPSCQVVFSRRAYDAFYRDVRTTERSYSLKINRGMLEGSTFWFSGEGHREQMQGPTDLVFVLRLAPHAHFERIGDDLWHYADTMLPAEALLFCAAVPTIDGRAPTPRALLAEPPRRPAKAVATLRGGGVAAMSPSTGTSQ